MPCPDRFDQDFHCPEIEPAVTEGNQHQVRSSNRKGGILRDLGRSIDDDVRIIPRELQDGLEEYRAIYFDDCTQICAIWMRRVPVQCGALWIGVHQEHQMSAFVQASGKVRWDGRFARQSTCSSAMHKFANVLMCD